MVIARRPEEWAVFNTAHRLFVLDCNPAARWELAGQTRVHPAFRYPGVTTPSKERMLCFGTRSRLALMTTETGLDYACWRSLIGCMVLPGRQWGPLCTGIEAAHLIYASFLRPLQCHWLGLCCIGTGP